MDQKKFMEIGKTVLQDHTPITVSIDIMQAWILVNGLQLLTRYPGVSEQMKAMWTHTGRQFQEVIVAAHPAVEELIEMGWNPDFDVDQDGNPINSNQSNDHED